MRWCFVVIAAIFLAGTVEPLPMRGEEHAAIDDLLGDASEPVAQSSESDDVSMQVQSVKQQINKANAAVHADTADNVAEKVALAKQYSMNNGQRLDQISSDAEEENEEMQSMKDKLEGAEKIVRNKMDVDKAIVDVDASNSLMKSIEAGKEQSELHQEKLAALKSTIEAHKNALDELHSNLAKMNAAKQKAHIEALEQKLHILELQMGEMQAQVSSKNSTEFILKQSQNITQEQIAKNKQVTVTKNKKAEALAGELEVLRATATQQESHLKKVEDAAVLNTKVQGHAMQQIKRKFDKEMSTLDDKVYAMKQSLALKKAHLKSISDEAKQEHEQLVQKTSALHRLAYNVKKEAKTNEYKAQRFKKTKKEQLGKMAELQEEYEKVKAEAATSQSRLQLEQKNMDAVRSVAEESQAKTGRGIDAAEAALTAAKYRIKDLSQEKATTSTQLHHAEIGVLGLVKDVAHTKIKAVPQHTKAKALTSMLNKTEAKKATVEATIQKWNSKIAELKPKVVKLLSQEQQLQMRQPQANGELEAVKATAEQKREEKRNAKLQAMETVARHKQAATRFAKIAPEAVLLQKKRDEAKKATSQAEDDIADVKAGTEMLKTQFGDKMEQAHADLKDEAEAAEKEESTAHVLGKAYATLVAEIASVKQTISQNQVEDARKERQTSAEMEETRSEVGQLTIKYDEAKSHLLHAKAKLQAFLNETAIKSELILERMTAEEHKLRDEAHRAEEKSASGMHNIQEIKGRVGQHMKQTILREKKMQMLRQRGIRKMAQYAKGVLTRLSAILASDDSQNNELKNELEELEKEVHAMQQRDAKEEKQDGEEESQVRDLKQKESESVLHTSEEVARQTEEILSVEGGQVTAEQQMQDADETRQKLEIAHLAEQIKTTEGRETNLTRSVGSETSSIEKLRQMRVAMRNKLQEYNDGVEREHTALREENTKNKDLQSELESLESQGARKKRQLALVIADEGVDSTKVKEMVREIAENKLKLQKMKEKLGVDTKRSTADVEEMSRLSLFVDQMADKLSRGKESAVQDNENAKLLGLKIHDSREAGRKDKEKEATLEEQIKVLMANLESANSNAASDLTLSQNEASKLKNMTKSEHKEHLKVLQEKIRIKAEGQRVQEEREGLQRAKKEERATEQSIADADAKDASLKAGVSRMKSQAELTAQQTSDAKAAAAMANSAAGVTNETASGMKNKLAAAAHKLEMRKEASSHLKSVLNTIVNKEEAEQHKQQVEEAEAEGEEAALKKQTLQVKAMASAATDRLARAGGEIQRLSRQQARLQNTTGEAASSEAVLAAKAKTEGALKAEDAAAVADLKARIAESDEATTSEMSTKTKNEGELAKADAVNGALQESLMRENAMNNETAKEIAKVEEAAEEADSDKTVLQSTLSEEDSDLSNLRKKNANDTAVLAADTAKLTNSRSAVANTMSGVERGSKKKKELVQQEEKELSGAKAKLEAADMNVGTLKAQLSGKQALLQTIQENSDELKVQLEKAEAKLTAAQQTRSDMQGRVQETRENAGRLSRDLEAKKLALQALEQSKSQAQAEGAAEVAAIKAQIADATEEETKAKSGIEELSNKMKVMDEDNAETETKTSKMGTELTLKAKQLQGLQKKQAVLRAFLSGPLLSGTDDGATDGSSTVTSTEEEEEEPAPTAATQLMEALPDLPPL